MEKKELFDLVIKQVEGKEDYKLINLFSNKLELENLVFSVNEALHDQGFCLYVSIESENIDKSFNLKINICF